MIDTTETGTRSPNAPGLPEASLADDLLEGAEAIAEFVFGDSGKRRTIYHLDRTKAIPTFKMGTKVCARKSTLLAWIRSQEDRAG